MCNNIPPSPPTPPKPKNRTAIVIGLVIGGIVLGIIIIGGVIWSYIKIK